MEDDIVVVASLGQCRKVLACLWCVLVVQLDRDDALDRVSILINNAFANSPSTFPMTLRSPFYSCRVGKSRLSQDERVEEIFSKYDITWEDEQSV